MSRLILVLALCLLAGCDRCEVTYECLELPMFGGEETWRKSDVMLQTWNGNRYQCTPKEKR